MGDVVDLDAFRKQREEKERAEARAEEEAKAAEEQAEIDYMQDVISRILFSLGGVTTGSMMSYPDSMTGYRYDDYPRDSFTFNTYYHEAGYNDDGYYEKSWEWDPEQAEASPVDWISSEDKEDPDEEV
jgi:hypothetical protein